MTTLIGSPPQPLPTARRFETAAEWWHSLGDVPLHRIIFDPLPGTATEADLLRLVEVEGRLCELIDGTLVEKPVGYFESKIANNLSAPLHMYVGEHDLGAVTGADSTLRMKSVDRIRLPDVSFVSKSREPTRYMKVPTLAPDLAGEVLSEGNTKAEIDQKLREYFDSGTRLAWIVQPAQRNVLVYRSAASPVAVKAESDRLDGEDVVPGFSIEVAALFRGVPSPAR